MSEYVDREFVAVPRLPLLSECAPLAAAVAGGRGRGGPAVPRYTETTTAPAPPSRGTADHAGTGRRRSSWRLVRLRLGKSGSRPVIEEDRDRQHVEISADDDRPSTSGGCTLVGESSRGTTTDSEAEPSAGRRRCNSHRKRESCRQRPRPDTSTLGGGDCNTGTVGNDRAVKMSKLERDVREVRRILQAYALRLSERDAHARVTKQWRLVARVLDRLFFFFYCATIMVSLATIFPR